MRDQGRKGRLVGLLVAAVAVLAIALPSSAGASFATHFSVVSKGVRGHNTANGGFSFRDVLLNPFNLNNVVGHDHVKCRPARPGKLRCAALFHLDGSIGGFGDLLVKGNLGRGDHTLNVVDGDGDFSGAVTGKAFVENLRHRTTLIDFALTR